MGLSSASAAVGPSPSRRSIARRVVLVALALVTALALPQALWNAVLDVAECEGPSMEPTLREGDTFLVDRTAYGARSPIDGRLVSGPWLPAIGDVVVALGPAGEGLIVKRVLGLPGDRMELRDDVVLRNGVAIARQQVGCDWSRAGEICVEERAGGRRWRTIRAASAPAETLEPIEVPTGHVYVLGDHRDASYDSRGARVGLVPVEQLVGRAWLLLSSPFAGRAPAEIE